MFASVPTPDTLLTSSSVWATAFSQDWLFFAYITVGVFLAVFLIIFLKNVFLDAFEYLGHYHKFGSESRSIQGKKRWYTVQGDQHGMYEHWHFGE